MLNVTMLQTPSVTLDGVPVSFPFKRADALLYYMLVRRSATRQELISLLWESCDEATGLKNLRNTLYTLKKTLGGDFLLSPQKSLVVVNSAWEVDCDYDRFTQQGDFSAYRGPFLQGFAVKHAFSFDEWLDRTREKLHEQYLGRLAQQAQAALRGEPIPPLPPLAQRCDTAVRQFELAAQNKGEKIACLEARKHYAWYLKGVPYAGYWKSEISKITTLADVYRVTAGIKRELRDGRGDG